MSKLTRKAITQHAALITDQCTRCGRRPGPRELTWVEGHGPLCKRCRKGEQIPGGGISGQSVAE